MTSPYTSIASRTTGSRRFSIDIVAMCSAWTRPRREVRWKPFGTRRASGRRLWTARGEATTMTLEINGMAHVILTVSRFEVAREFYRKLLPEFGMKPVFDGDKLFYCVGARTAIGIEPCAPALAGERFVQRRVALHHLCLRARSREAVDR